MPRSPCRVRPTSSNICQPRVESLEARDLLSRYFVTDLGDFGARALNREGQIAGLLNGEPSLWDHGRIRDLGMPDGYTLISIQAINDAGDVVGSGLASDNAIHPLRWDANGVTDLGRLGPDSYALGINNAGMVAGWSDLEDGGAHPVMWPAGSGPIDLEPDGGVTADFAYGVNDAGQIAGLWHDRASRWNPDGSQDVLESDYGLPTVGQAINAAGDVAGSAVYWVDFGRTYASPAVWTVNGFTDLGLLPGTAEGRATAINDAGDVVGQAGTGTVQRGWLWQDGRLRDLNGLVHLSGYTIVGGAAINNAGQILVAGRPDAGGPFHSFLLTPPTGLSPELGIALLWVRQHSP